MAFDGESGEGAAASEQKDLAGRELVVVTSSEGRGCWIVEVNTVCASNTTITTSTIITAEDLQGGEA